MQSAHSVCCHAIKPHCPHPYILHVHDSNLCSSVVDTEMASQTHMSARPGLSTSCDDGRACSLRYHEYVDTNSALTMHGSIVGWMIHRLHLLFWMTACMVWHKCGAAQNLMPAMAGSSTKRYGLRLECANSTLSVCTLIIWHSSLMHLAKTGGLMHLAKTGAQKELRRRKWVRRQRRGP